MTIQYHQRQLFNMLAPVYCYSLFYRKSLSIYRTEFKDVRCTEEVKQVEVAYLQPFLVEQQSLPSHPHPAQPLTLPSYSFLTL